MTGTERRQIAEGARRRCDAAASRADALRGRRDALLALRDSAEGRSAAQEAETVLLASVQGLLQSLYDTLVRASVGDLAGTVTEGLGVIFHDQVLRCAAEVELRKSGVGIDLAVEAETPLGVVRGDPLTSFGGGVTAVVDLIVRVVTLLRCTGLRPILVLDETLGAVSDDYIPATARFFSALCKKAGLDVLLVTHKPAFGESADIVYRVGRDARGRFLIVRETPGSESRR